MKTILLSLAAAALLMTVAPTQADARPWRYRVAPRVQYRANYYRPYAYRTYYRPAYRPYAYRYWGPGYYRGPGVSIGVY